MVDSRVSWLEKALVGCTHQRAWVIKRYHAPEPPVMQALTHTAISEADKLRLRAMLADVDPVLLLAGIRAS